MSGHEIALEWVSSRATRRVGPLARMTLDNGNQGHNPFKTAVVKWFPQDCMCSVIAVSLRKFQVDEGRRDVGMQAEA